MGCMMGLLIYRHRSADSIDNLAEKGGFEPPSGYYPEHAFQACDLNHSSTSPKGAQNKPERVFLQLNLMFKAGRAIFSGQ